MKVTKIENAIFWYNTALSEANVKINGTGSTKWTYYKEWGFANNYFVFLNLFFRLRASYKKLIWCTNYPNVHIHTFCNRWSFLWVFTCEHFKPTRTKWNGSSANFSIFLFFFLIASWIGLFYQIGCTYFYLFVISLTHEKLRMLSPLSIVSYTCSLLYN